MSDSIDVPDNGAITGEDAFASLAVALSPDLARFLERQVRDHAIAEDLLQETLLRIARGLADFDGRSSVKTWAFAIATRVAIDHFRRRSGLPPAVELDAAVELPDTAHTPEEGLVVGQMNDCIRDMIAALPPDYREAIMLHDFGGLSARETAAVCGCSEANAKVRIHRGRARLKQGLVQQCELYRDGDNVLCCHRKD
ncbi:MAG: RNA polymerase sigma factor [Ectothiorhodospiraceae bacterium]|nr:RNA polymerase sigma factor [Ectothiorhodospiraceae bacterium]